MNRQFNKLSVLVVEDLLPMRRLMAAVLTSLGIGRVTVSDNGEEGYRKFLDEQPDILLTDWLMRPMDGIELTKKIRFQTAQPKRRYAPIIMITGYTAEHRIREARDAGVTEILVKPFTAADLTKRLAYVVNKPRDFVECETFFGPDRRRRADPRYTGPFRRGADHGEKSAWEIEF